MGFPCGWGGLLFIFVGHETVVWTNEGGAVQQAIHGAVSRSPELFGGQESFGSANQGRLSGLQRPA